MRQHGDIDQALQTLEDVALRCWWSNPDRSTRQRMTAVAEAVLAALTRELRAQIEQIIAALPHNQREVITLRDIEGWSAEEACTLLNLSEANQRVLLHRARAKVRTALDQYINRV